ncbi:MAG: ABC transporter permease [Dysgonamonadaceae bacterium]|jgi:lipoprotein-releasing system permease protein|nr:ABC transporter permease [Dysgonamonadaceae bacterium]
MNTEFFIARRIYFSKSEERKASPPAIRIAMASIAMGLAVMVLAVAIMIGFKQEVRNKMIGFGSHIQITDFGNSNSYESSPIVISDSIINDVILKTPNIAQVHLFSTKPGIIKTDEDFMGIVLKGVDADYNWDFFKQNLVKGDVPEYNDDSTSVSVLISRIMSQKMKLDAGDSFLSFYIMDNGVVRARKFNITGIYETNFSEYDKIFVLSDIKQVRRLNQWDTDQVSGVEILVKDYNKLDETAESLYYEMSVLKDRNGNSFLTQSIGQIRPEIFAWLGILDTNVVVIIILMLAVAGFSMISGLLIIILERINMIGVLKVLGENNTSIRKIFLYISSFIISKGLFWGNLIGIGICLIQKHFEIFKLDPASYYISAVPIELNLWHVIIINVGTLLLSLLMLIGPSYLVARISPTKSIRFD